MSQLVDRARSGLASLKEKGAFAILAGSFLTKIAAFLGSLILVRIMPKSEFGVLGYMENLYTYALSLRRIQTQQRRF